MLSNLSTSTGETVLSIKAKTSIQSLTTGLVDPAPGAIIFTGVVALIRWVFIKCLVLSRRGTGLLAV